MCLISRSEYLGSSVNLKYTIVTGHCPVSVLNSMATDDLQNFPPDHCCCCCCWTSLDSKHFIFQLSSKSNFSQCSFNLLLKCATRDMKLASWIKMGGFCSPFSVRAWCWSGPDEGVGRCPPLGLASPPAGQITIC